MPWKPESVSREDYRESPLRAIASTLWFVFILAPVMGVKFAWQQLSGTVGNIRKFVEWLQFDYILPPFIRDTIQWTIEIVPRAVGVRDTTRNEQVASAFVLLVVAFISTLLTGGLAVATYIIVSLMLLAGTARFVPWIDNRWKWTREQLPIKDDYDVWRWSRE